MDLKNEFYWCVFGGALGIAGTALIFDSITLMASAVILGSSLIVVRRASQRTTEAILSDGPFRPVSYFSGLVVAAGIASAGFVAANSDAGRNTSMMQNEKPVEYTKLLTQSMS